MHICRLKECGGLINQVFRSKPARISVSLLKFKFLPKMALCFSVNTCISIFSINLKLKWKYLLDFNLYGHHFKAVLSPTFCQEETKISWMKMPRQLLTRGRMKITTNERITFLPQPPSKGESRFQLKLEPVIREDAGEYRCIYKDEQLRFKIAILNVNGIDLW